MRIFKICNILIKKKKVVKYFYYRLNKYLLVRDIIRWCL